MVFQRHPRCAPVVYYTNEGCRKAIEDGVYSSRLRTSVCDDSLPIANADDVACRCSVSVETPIAIDRFLNNGMVDDFESGETRTDCAASHLFGPRARLSRTRSATTWERENKTLARPSVVRPWSAGRWVGKTPALFKRRLHNVGCAK